MKPIKRTGDAVITILFFGIIICFIMLVYYFPTKVEEKIEENHKEALIQMKNNEPAIRVEKNNQKIFNAMTKNGYRITSNSKDETIYAKDNSQVNQNIIIPIPAELGKEEREKLTNTIINSYAKNNYIVTSIKENEIVFTKQSN